MNTKIQLYYLRLRIKKKNIKILYTNKTLFLLFLFLLAFNYSCKKDKDLDDELDVQIPQYELTESEQEIVDELNTLVTPLLSTSPSFNNTSDLSAFDSFASASVIGLGEATHGTKEFFHMKHRIFKYFVENHGFRIFGFEADMGECIYIDRFITKGTGTIDEVMEKMHFWTWKTQEVKDLILWMKDYNIGKDESNQIHFLGVDCQYETYHLTLIEEYLNEYDDNHSEYISNIFDRLSHKSDGRANTNKDGIQERCDSIYSYFETNKNLLINKSGKFEYDIILKLVDGIRQFLEASTNNTQNLRDFYMAENTIWLTSLLGGNAKVVSWAHNGHISKNPDYTPLGSSQGYYLSQKLVNNYKVIGFSFNQGSFRAMKQNENNNHGPLTRHTISQLPLKESINYILGAIELEDFILVLSNIQVSNTLDIWLNSPHNMMKIGAIYSISHYDDYYRSCILQQHYDAIIHINQTTSAVGAI